MNQQSFNMDCQVGMQQYPNKHFDLAIVDPEYGISAASRKSYFSRNKKTYNQKNWDESRADKKYFEKLFRISKNQIIWGGNYFTDFLFPSKGWIVWDKLNGTNDMPDCELAWTSFNCKIKKITLHHFHKNYDKERIHITQKPVHLYKWILNNYSCSNQRIIDTHLGSGSSRIAAYELGFEFVGFEIDKEMYELQEKRFNQHISQLKLF